MKTLIMMMVSVSMAFYAMADEQLYPPVAQDVIIFEQSAIFPFDFDEDDLNQEEIAAAQVKIAELVAYLNENPDKKIRIEGHADETGTTTYNLDLTVRRVTEIFEYLVAAGVNESQIVAVAYGEVNPLEDGHSDAAWAANRRVFVAIHE